MMARVGAERPLKSAGWVSTVSIAFIFAVSTIASADVGSQLLPGIVGSDDRQSLGSEEWPWSAIGRLNKQGAGFCTGALVRADRVLTAAHCLLNRATGQLHRPDFLTFVAGYSRGRYRAVRPIRSYVTPCSRVLPLPDRLADMGCDIAILELEEPINSIRPIPRTDPGESGSLLLAGYQQDRPYMLSVDKACHLVKWINRGVFLHDCDGVKGASGAPLLRRQQGDQFMIIGVYLGYMRQTAATSETVGVAAAWQPHGLPQ